MLLGLGSIKQYTFCKNTTHIKVNSSLQYKDNYDENSTPNAVCLNSFQSVMLCNGLNIADNENIMDTTLFR